MSRSAENWWKLLELHNLVRLRCCLMLAVSVAASLPLPASEADFRRQTQQRYVTAKSNYMANAYSEPAAVAFGEAAFDWADFAATPADRAAIAEEGIAAMRELLLSNARSAPGHYYLALNMGQLARTRMLGALPLVRDMEKALKTSIELDPVYNYAGAHRSLGMLYFEAPGWPTSIGNKSKARHHLEKAIELAPDHPENHLALLEAYARWKEAGNLQTAINRYRKLLPQMKEKYGGREWNQSWADWEKRWRTILDEAR